jgi:hypothetical protein
MLKDCCTKSKSERIRRAFRLVTARPHQVRMFLQDHPFGEKHLRLPIREYFEHYHRERNHQGLDSHAWRGKYPAVHCRVVDFRSLPSRSDTTPRDIQIYLTGRLLARVLAPSKTLLPVGTISHRFAKLHHLDTTSGSLLRGNRS